MNDKSSLMDEIAQTRDEKRLLEIYRANDDIDVRYAIVNLVDDDEILHKIFAIEKDDFIKSIALERISSDIIGYDDFNSLDDYEKISFIEEHDSESLLESILKNDDSLKIRIAAVHTFTKSFPANHFSMKSPEKRPPNPD